MSAEHRRNKSKSVAKIAKVLGASNFDIQPPDENISQVRIQHTYFLYSVNVFKITKSLFYLGEVEKKKKKVALTGEKYFARFQIFYELSRMREHRIMD